MKPDLIYFSAYLPGPKAPQGGHKTAYRHLLWLCEKYRVHLVAFHGANDGEPESEILRELCASVRIFPVNNLRRLWGILTRPDLPRVAAVRWQERAARYLKQLCRTVKPERVHIEWTQLASYRSCFDLVPLVTLNTHDILAQQFHRMSQRQGSPFWWRLEHACTEKWERAAWATMSVVYAPSAKDADLITRGDPTTKVQVKVLPPPFQKWTTGNRRDFALPANLLFWGAMNRPENQEAADWLRLQLLPMLRQDDGRITLTVAGGNPSSQLQAASGSEGVTVTGFLEDPTACFDSSHLAVLPLFRGAGVKIKILECLASGLPVITTPIGAEGIEAGEEDGLYTVPPTKLAFSECIQKLFSAPERLATASAAAERWGKRHAGDFRQTLLS